MTVIPGCYMHETPVKGWRIESVQHVRRLCEASRWRIELMRERDGAIVGYESFVSLALAYEGVSRAAVESDKGENE